MVKKGDKLLIKFWDKDHPFSVGEVVTVVAIDGICVLAKNKNGDMGYLVEQEFELIEK